jgi:hypothetical protein
LIWADFFFPLVILERKKRSQKFVYSGAVFHNINIANFKQLNKHCSIKRSVFNNIEMYLNNYYNYWDRKNRQRYFIEYWRAWRLRKQIASKKRAARIRLANWKKRRWLFYRRNINHNRIRFRNQPYSNHSSPNGSQDDNIW